MKRFAVALLVLLSMLCFAQSGGKKFVPVTKFDPARNAAKDIADAVQEANRTGKHVFVDVGGTWCVWCAYFDKIFETNVPLRDYREEHYVTVKVNYSKDQPNTEVIAKYGKISGYPHIFILDGKGNLLHSQDTSKLEEGQGYNIDAVAKFLQDWAPKKK